MVNKKLKSVYSKIISGSKSVSNYFFGVPSRKEYNDRLHLIREFYRPECVSTTLDSLKHGKKLEIGYKNFINLAASLNIYATIKDPSEIRTCIFTLASVELGRFLVHKIFSGDKSFYKQIKKYELSKIKPESLDKLLEEYELKNKGEEWKNK